MTKAPNLQDIFLAAARRGEIPLTVFLVNGFQMRGTITGFDAFTVVLAADGKQNDTDADKDQAEESPALILHISGHESALRSGCRCRSRYP